MSSPASVGLCFTLLQQHSSPVWAAWRDSWAIQEIISVRATKYLSLLCFREPMMRKIFAVWSFDPTHVLSPCNPQSVNRNTPLHHSVQFHSDLKIDSNLILVLGHDGQIKVVKYHRLPHATAVIQQEDAFLSICAANIFLNASTGKCFHHV